MDRFEGARRLDPDGLLAALATGWLAGGGLAKADFARCLEEGADACVWVEGGPLLASAAASQDGDAPWVCEELLRAGAGLWDAGADEKTPLARACEEGLARTAQVLMKASKGRVDAQARALAVERADPDMLAALIEGGVDAARLRSFHEAPALAAWAGLPEGGSLECSRLLIHAGADPPWLGCCWRPAPTRERQALAGSSRSRWRWGPVWGA
jgi:hypothetical protein